MDFTKLNEAIAREFDVPVDAISPEKNIRRTLDLDSMRAMTLLVVVHKHTGIMIPPRHAPRLTTFQTLYDYIEQKRSSNNQIVNN